MAYLVFDSVVQHSAVDKSNSGKSKKVSASFSFLDCMNGEGRVVGTVDRSYTIAGPRIRGLCTSLTES